MLRGVRTIRYILVAVVLLIAAYKLSANTVRLEDYTKFAPSNPFKGSTHGSQATAPGDSYVIPPSANLENAHSPAIDTPSSIAAAPIDGNSELSVATAHDTPYQRENATFVTLVRNSELWNIISSIHYIEDRFNHQYHYDWVFLNDDEFSDEFKRVVSAHVSGKAIFGKVGPEHWSIPDFIDKNRAELARQRMANEGVIYGGSLPYRHMCRFEAGFFFDNAALANYKYYWRVEPDIRIFCDVNYDVFRYMRENKKSYGFTISLTEFTNTIKTLWETTKNFTQEFPQHIHPNNAISFISDNNGETYNLCHFWSNFEVGDLDFWRSTAYRDYFNYLDRSGGFFYERWGDAPVHSIAAALFLNQSEIHYFDDIGYYHGSWSNCPVDPGVRDKLRCTCPYDSSLPENERYIFTFKSRSCTSKWYDLTGLERPKGWEDWKD